MKGGKFVLTMLREAERNRQMEVSSEQVMSPTYAVDLAAATLALVNTGTPDPIYHLTNDGQCSWAEFAMAILKAAGKDMVIVPVDRSGTSYAAGRPPFAVLQNTRARALGITLPGWRDAVERYVRWLGDVPA
jgi:dTDP-4-dehydrorhamnose reductase